MATAKKLPSGSWRVQTYEDGVRRSYTAETKKEAERLAALGLVENDLRKKQKLTLGQAMDAYIDTCRAQGLSPSTVAEYIARKNASFPLLIDKQLDRITVHDVQRQVDARAADHSIKTVRNDYFLLKAVLALYAPSLDLRQIRLAKRPKRPRMLLSEALPEQILQAVQDEPADLQIYVLLSMFAGLRPSEVCALRWSDLSAKRIRIKAKPSYYVGEISVSAAEVRDEHGAYQRKAPKTEAGNRVQTISWAVFERIYSLKSRGKDEEKVVTLNSKDAAKRWKQLRDAGAVPETLRLYDLRHFYATAVANSGASEEELAARMGHSTSSFSHQVYVELFEERRANVNAALSAAASRALAAVPQTGKTAHKTAHD